ncbi:MAG: DNA repair protein RecO [Clostridia bacterium]|nr:DNA repair protein RecO [Clostridia bacterium]MBQ5487431.1 DNA repair protein RecO [Clostridia bacterium]
MAFQTLTGIVLRYTDYRDNDRILSVLTRENGLVSVTARGVRAKGKTVSSNVKDAYCYGEFIVYERNGIDCVSSSTIIEAFYPIREDYDKLLAAAQIVRIAEKLASNRPNDELFSMLYHAFSFLAYGNAQPADLVLCFAAKFLALAGYAPVLTNCSCCGKPVTSEKQIPFSFKSGGSLCTDCASDQPTYSALALEAFRRMMRLEDKDMDKVRLPESARTELNKLIFDYAEYVLEQPIRLKNPKLVQ